MEFGEVGDKISISLLLYRLPMLCGSASHCCCNLFWQVAGVYTISDSFLVTHRQLIR
jgi:hypothetical protein